MLVEQDDARLGDGLRDAPAQLKTAARTRLPALRKLLTVHPQALEEIESALGG